MLCVHSKFSVLNSFTFSSFTLWRLSILFLKSLLSVHHSVKVEFSPSFYTGRMLVATSLEFSHVLCVGGTHLCPPATFPDEGFPHPSPYGSLTCWVFPSTVTAHAVYSSSHPYGWCLLPTTRPIRTGVSCIQSPIQDGCQKKCCIISCKARQQHE